MASQYSILRNYGEYVSPYNMDLIAQGMEYLQGKVDTNRQMINDYVDQIVNSDIVKPQDREYLQNRLNGIINDVNDSFRRSNLSSDGVARSIQSRLGEAVDTRVMNAIAGTREFRSLQKTIEDIKLNKPDEYSSINEAMAYMPFYQWFNDGQVGSRMEPLHYTPYYDYTTEVNKSMKDAISLRKSTTLQTPGSREGEIIETTIDRLPYDTARYIGEQSLSQRAQAQIALEGQYMALTNPGMFNQDSTQAFIRNYTDSFDRRERALLGELKNAEGDEARKTMLESSLADLRSQRQSFIDEASSFIGNNFDPARAGAFIVRNEFLRGVGMRWSYDNSYSVSKKDEVYWETRKANLEDAKFAWRKQYDKRRLDIAQTRAESSGRSDRSSRTVGDDESLRLTPIDVPMNLNAELRPSDEFFLRYDGNENSKRNEVTRLWNSLGEDDRIAIEDSIRTSMENENEAHLYDGCETREDRIIRYFDVNQGAKAEMLGNPAALAAWNAITSLRDRQRSYDNISLEAISRSDDMMRSFGDEVVRVARSSNGGGIDVYTDAGIVNARDLMRGGSVSIGGRRFAPEEALQLSALTSFIAETKADFFGGVDNSDRARVLLRKINEIYGSDITLDELATIYGGNLFKEGSFASLAGKIERDPELRGLLDLLRFGNRQENLLFRRKWTNYGAVSDMVDASERAYSDTFREHYNEFSTKSYAVRGDNIRSEADRLMFSDMQGMFNSAGKKVEDDMTFHVELDDSDNPWLIGSYADGSERQMISVSRDRLNEIGYVILQDQPVIRSDTYETVRPVRTSFASFNNEAYSSMMVDMGLPFYANADDAKKNPLLLNVINYYTGIDDEKRLELRAIADTVIDNMGSYAVDAKGQPGRVNVDIYPAASADRRENRLYSLPYVVPYADEISVKMNMCPQAFVMEALENAFNVDMQAYMLDPNSESERLRALISTPELRAKYETRLAQLRENYNQRLRDAAARI